MQREFKGVWIPKEIYLNKNLTPKQKIEWVEKAYGIKSDEVTK